ncbi:hypothetical protein C8R45DRAFT_1216088 [Mycena sanguinolenta]|nr:hypothetical protein C8R45DRAFT_1216088 [Mycena sanguinolenta]
MVAPACWIPGLLFVLDFQGSSFNLAFGTNPIISASGTPSATATNEQELAAPRHGSDSVSVFVAPGRAHHCALRCRPTSTATLTAAAPPAQLKLSLQLKSQCFDLSCHTLIRGAGQRCR